ncbi:MAG: ApaG protein [Bacteroidetes bacterium OLB11]|nr:MAG: ApaG protein [Bacteroidetes bacterium OLB11]
MENVLLLQNMQQQITEGISITVEVFYNKEQSNPLLNEYTFAYRISIDNLADFPVKLLKRHWRIFDSNGSVREVEGDGVVGQQPVLEPGESFQYVSGASIKTDMGKMSGTYQMENLTNKKLIKVHIPEFELITPFKLN